MKPDETDRIRRDILGKHRLARRARLEALAMEGRALRLDLKRIAERVITYSNHVEAELSTIRAEETPTRANPIV